MKQIIKFILSFFVSDFAREDVLNSLAERVVSGELPPWRLSAEIQRINEEVDK